MVHKHPECGVIITGDFKDYFTELSSTVPSFLDHTFVKRKQQSFFRKCTQDMFDGEITVQIYFAENYAVKEQTDHICYCFSLVSE